VMKQTLYSIGVMRQVSVPRKSIADKLLLELECIGGNGDYLVVYDFSVGRGGRIPLRFYRNLRILIERLGGVDFVQKSVLLCKGKKAALAVAKLVEHYGGNVRIFQVVERDVESC